MGNKKRQTSQSGRTNKMSPNKKTKLDSPGECSPRKFVSQRKKGHSTTSALGLSMTSIDKKAVTLFQANDVTPEWTKPFPIVGKGIFLFNIARNTPFYILVRDKTSSADNESWIGLTVTQERVSFLNKIRNGVPQTICETDTSDYFGANVGIEPDHICTYWLSYDRDRMVIKYGKGYRMEQTTIMEYDYGNLEEEQQEVIRELFFDPKVDRYVEIYNDQPWGAAASEAGASTYAIADMEKQVDFDPVPLVSDLPPVVRDSSTTNLFDLDSGKYMYSANLPVECQPMYSNIVGVNVDLDYQGTDPKNQYAFKLSDAMRYSIETEGCALYEKLKSKVGEFGKSDPKETYLRVTLGMDAGNSPGVPYVLEIWPKDHGSPVHNHGNAYGVIRVLHGGLTIRYFNKVSESINSEEDDSEEEGSPDVPQLGKFTVGKGDITWLNPNWYATHKLWNETDDYCATIQCYQYGNNDEVNWPYFDYMKSCDIIGEFKPDSDYSFTEMYDLVMREYDRNM